jgi:hypothetical protein
MNKGWECPKCGVVYAPWVSKCEKCEGKVIGGAYVVPVEPSFTQPIITPPQPPWPGYPRPYTGDPLPPNNMPSICQSVVTT